MAVHAVLVMALALAVVPFAWAVLSSLKTNDAIFIDPFSIPASPRWGNYAEAWSRGRFGTYFINSVAIAVPSVLLTLACSSLAGFAFARLRFMGNTWIFLGFLVGLAIPTNAILIPLYGTVRGMGLLDSLPGVILPQVAAHLPFGIFLMRAFFRTLPADLEDAARIDGCNDIGVYLHIMLPLSMGALTSLLVFSFMGSWNDFLIPYLFIQNDAMRTIPLGLLFFQGSFVSEYRLLFAGIVISFIPTLVLYVIFQRQFVRGITVGAVRG
ncbi:MAG: carbohydrate ABC transporter permease [Chloroflexi bacterium]|nr:carbohydrate ABC transporter permease [Chloroflexota bacterium]